MSWGSMTSGAVSSLVICRYLLLRACAVRDRHRRAAWALAAVGTFVVLRGVSAVPLRAASEAELAGLDVAIHGEVGYDLE